MYGTLLAFSIALIIVSIALAASRVDARDDPPHNFWLGVFTLFIMAVTLLGFATSGMAG